MNPDQRLSLFPRKDTNTGNRQGAFHLKHYFGVNLGQREACPQKRVSQRDFGLLVADCGSSPSVQIVSDALHVFTSYAEAHRNIKASVHVQLKMQLDQANVLVCALPCYHLALYTVASCDLSHCSLDNTD